MGQGQLKPLLQFTHVPLPQSSFYEWGLWVCRQRWRWRVQGASMLPSLYPGDQVLVDVRAYRRSPPHVGDIVMAQHPERVGLYLVKRIVAIDAAGHYFLQGDNPSASTDSHDFGALPRSLILGKVTSCFEQTPTGYR